MDEWVRLSAEGAIGNARTRRDDAGEYEIDDGYNVIELTKPETLAFARQLPEVMTLFDTMKEIAGGSCCQTPGCCIDDPMCTAMTARAAVARFNDHEQ